MATIIEELIVRLGISTKDLDKGTPAATKKLKDLEQQGAKTEASFKAIGKTSKESASAVGELTSGFGKLLAVLGGAYAIKAFVQDTIASSAALGRLSKNLNLSVEDLSAWGNAVEQMGGSAKGLQGTLSMLSQSQTELRLTGQSALLPYFNNLQIAFAGVDGKARPVNDILLDLADRFSHLDRPTANNLGKMMGIDQDTLNLLLQGRREVELMISRQKDFNAVSKAQAEQSAKLQRSIIGLKQSFTALGRDLLQQAAPALERILGWLEKIGGWAQSHQQFIVDFLKVMAGGLATLGLAALPLDPLVIAITAVGAAIALLWDDYQTFQKGGQSLIPWDKWKPGIDAAINAAKTLGKIWVTELQAIVTAVQFAQAAINGDWGTAKNKLVAGTERMNKRWGIGGPDEAHDQNAAKADKFVQSLRMPPSSFDITGHGGGKPSKEQLMAYFMAHGNSKKMAAALTANAWSESSGDPGVSGDNGSAYGLFQWHGDRQANFKKRYGFDIRKASWQQQADFAMFELSPQGNERRAGNDMRGAGSAGDMAAIESRESQRPGLTQAAKDNAAAFRSSMAQGLMGIQGASSTARLAGQPGASSSTTSNDHSVNITNGPVTIQTQGTDAMGIARDWIKSFGYQFTGQANSGLS